MTARASAAVSATSILLLLASGVPHGPLLVWNASASAPIGLYAASPPDMIARGDLVLAFAPRSARALAAQRGYLPWGVPLVKYVAALQGDRVCANGLRVFINGVEAAIRLRWDHEGRPLPRWHGCKKLARDDVFLLNGPVLHSFDGRYFGTVPRRNLVGKLRPLWLP